MGDLSGEVKSFWEKGSCGTELTREEKYSRNYFEEIEKVRYDHEPFIHSFAQFSRWRGKQILEVGVGAGTDFLQFVRAGAEAHGVDLTEEAVKNVKHRLATYGLEAKEVQTCNAESLPYPDNRFDLVYSWGVIHHANDMEKVFSEIYRVTKPGGTVKLMIYNYHSAYTAFMYTRHCLLKGRILKTPKWAIFNFQESIGTKVYTKQDVIHMLKRYPHSNLKFEFWDPRVFPGVKLAKARKWIKAAMPEAWRWYLAFEFTKR